MTPGQPYEPDSACPRWCVVDHTGFCGEDAHVHVGGSQQLTTGITVRLAASHSAGTTATDGPYVLLDAPQLALDSIELSLRDARNIGLVLVGLADQGEHLARVLALPTQRDPGPST